MIKTAMFLISGMKSNAIFEIQIVFYHFIQYWLIMDQSTNWYSRHCNRNIEILVLCNSNIFNLKFQFSESFSFELYVCNHFFPPVLILLALLLQKLCMSFVLYGVRTTLVWRNIVLMAYWSQWGQKVYKFAIELILCSINFLYCLVWNHFLCPKIKNLSIVPKNVCCHLIGKTSSFLANLFFEFYQTFRWLCKKTI